MIQELLNQNLKWIDVQEPGDEDLEKLTNDFALPHLLVQDCLSPEHLPKYEETDNGHFLMIRSFNPTSNEESTSVQDLTKKLAFFITENRLITIHRVKLDYLKNIATKIERLNGQQTLQALIHQVILASIRTYETPIMRLQDIYEDFEQEILEKKAQFLPTNRIYHFRRQIFILKRILKQTNDALFKFKEFWDEHPSMLQDLRENLDQRYFQLDEVSNNFEHLFELHIAINDQRANEVMKILTVFSTILLPLNFIASFYGMNFAHFPGIKSTHALTFVMLSMLILIILTVWYFYRKGWFKTHQD